jgi:hypothetical protein
LIAPENIVVLSLTEALVVSLLTSCVIAHSDLQNVSSLAYSHLSSPLDPDILHKLDVGRHNICHVFLVRVVSNHLGGPKHGMRSNVVREDGKIGCVFGSGSLFDIDDFEMERCRASSFAD